MALVMNMQTSDCKARNDTYKSSASRLSLLAALLVSALLVTACATALKAWPLVLRLALVRLLVPPCLALVSGSFWLDSQSLVPASFGTSRNVVVALLDLCSL